MLDMMMSRSRSWEREEEDIEERWSWSCMSMGKGLKRNQVIDHDYCLSLQSTEEEEEDWESSEELFEINLKIIKKEPLPLVLEEEDEGEEGGEEWERSTVFSLDIDDNMNKMMMKKDIVYVAVREDGDSSMEALSWALKHAITTPSTTLSLLHVFPKVNLIPSPLGKIPRSHVNLEHVNIYLSQVKCKRKLLLQKFTDLCVESKVKVEIMLIEGDNVAKTILDVVTNLNIRKLVIGASKSNLRKSGSGRHNIADKILKDAQESCCDIKIICEGREVMDKMIGCSSTSIVSQEKDGAHGGFVTLKRFMPSSLWLFRSRFLSPR